MCVCCLNHGTKLAAALTSSPNGYRSCLSRLYSPVCATGCGDACWWAAGTDHQPSFGLRCRRCAWPRSAQRGDTRGQVELLDVREPGVRKPEDYPPGKHLFVFHPGEAARNQPRWQFGVEENGRCKVRGSDHPVPGMPWRHTRNSHREANLDAETTRSLLDRASNCQRFPQDCFRQKELWADTTERGNAITRDRAGNALCLTISVWSEDNGSATFPGRDKSSHARIASDEDHRWLDRKRSQLGSRIMPNGRRAKSCICGGPSYGALPPFASRPFRITPGNIRQAGDVFLRLLAIGLPIAGKAERLEGRFQVGSGLRGRLQTRPTRWPPPAVSADAKSRTPPIPRRGARVCRNVFLERPGPDRSTRRNRPPAMHDLSERRSPGCSLRLLIPVGVGVVRVSARKTASLLSLPASRHPRRRDGNR